MPARLPDQVKALRGTLRPGRKNSRAPRLDNIKVPPPPRDLSPTERVVWRRLAREVPPGVFTSADATSFRLLVQAVALAEDPPAGTTDSARIHWSRLAQSLLNQFGMTPASREKVSVAGSSSEVDKGDEEFATDGTGLRVVR